MEAGTREWRRASHVVVEATGASAGAGAGRRGAEAGRREARGRQPDSQTNRDGLTVKSTAKRVSELFVRGRSTVRKVHMWSVIRRGVCRRERNPAQTKVQGAVQGACVWSKVRRSTKGCRLAEQQQQRAANTLPKPPTACSSSTMRCPRPPPNNPKPGTNSANSIDNSRRPKPYGDMAQHLCGPSAPSCLKLAHQGTSIHRASTVVNTPPQRERERGRELTVATRDVAPRMQIIQHILLRRTALFMCAICDASCIKSPTPSILPRQRTATDGNPETELAKGPPSARSTWCKHSPRRRSRAALYQLSMVHRGTHNPPAVCRKLFSSESVPIIAPGGL